ncbi:hypothetical protein KGY73_03235 [bacterium]|nr:hypothetical protein [bacterium]
MKKAKWAWKITVIFPIIILLFSCNPMENETRSNSMLIVQNITGTDIEDNEVNFLQSDVVIGTQTATADTATVTLAAKLLNPEPLLGLGASHYNDIKVTRYVVSYHRTDGKNVEGEDVPYSFEGSLSALVEIDSTTEISFVIVREVAKEESPLVDLREKGGERVLEVEAKVEFYGHDLAGRKVKATGYLPIFFANYADEEG